jgi:allophanate hydrolase
LSTIDDVLSQVLPRASGLVDPHDVVDGVLGRLAARGDDATWISLADPAALRARAEQAARRAAATVHVPIAPFVEAGDLLYAGPWVAERLAGLEPLLAAHADDVLAVTRAVLERGRDFTAVDAFPARHRLQELRAQCNRAWLDADVLLLPTLPTTFTRAQLAEEPVARNLVLGRYTQFANLLDLAALAVPAGSTADGRPVGVTLLGPAFSEARLFAAARQLLNPAEEDA